jgi:hypothetical protein
MKTNWRRLMPALVGLALLAAAAPAFAAFEDVEVSPRARALGGAFSALPADAYAPFHNAAALAWTGEPNGAASFVKPFGYDFSQQIVASGTMSAGKLGGLGIGVRHFGVEYRDENLTGETTISLAHGFQLLKDMQSTLAAGWTINLYHLDYGMSVDADPAQSGSGIDPGSATAFGVDFSAQATIYNRTRVGFYALNMNNPTIGKTDKEDLIRRVGAGVAYMPYKGVTTALDISSTLGDPLQFRGGTEFDVNEYLCLRAGIRSEPSIFTAGVGISQYGITVDYGFSTGGGTLEATHQFGVSYVLSSGK